MVQSAGDVASAAGRGVGEVVQIVSESDIPPLPQLPNIPNLPNLGNIGNILSGGDSSNKPFDLFGRKRR